MRLWPKRPTEPPLAVPVQELVPLVAQIRAAIDRLDAKIIESEKRDRDAAE